MRPDVSKYAIDEVEKMLHCRDPEYGFLTYKCPECGATKTVPLACKSRICPQCGKKYADEWADQLAQTLYAVPHRHMVFTIPEELRSVLDADRSLLKVLMDAVSNTMQQMIKEKHGAVPGVVCVLHPYGKDMKLNPHVHVLATEGGLTKAGEWVPVSFLEYGALRRIWQYQLLTMVKRELPKTWENSRFIDKLFKEHKEGFYVYAKRRVSKPKHIARYIGRYLRHPAIAESRISEFNVETNMVTFWYEEKGEKKFVTLSALEFIDRLVRLIPDKNLKLIRYYGLYSRRTSAKLQKMLTPLSREKPSIQPKKEVVKCPKCGQTMELVGATRPNADDYDSDDDSW
jgi:adenylate kinase family enzyme/ribosomal protein S27E